MPDEMVPRARNQLRELADPRLAAMMTALKDRHVANARVERLGRGAAVAAAEVLESAAIEELPPNWSRPR